MYNDVFTLRGFSMWKMFLKGLNTVNDPKLITMPGEQGQLRSSYKKIKYNKERERERASKGGTNYEFCNPMTQG